MPFRWVHGFDGGINHLSEFFHMNFGWALVDRHIQRAGSRIHAAPVSHKPWTLKLAQW